jgi:hypothetical protein
MSGSIADPARTRADTASIDRTVELPVLKPWSIATARTARGGKLHRKRISVPITAPTHPCSAICSKLTNDISKVVGHMILKQIIVLGSQQRSNAAKHHHV